MNHFESYNCSVMGYSHISKGIPCQDASASLDRGDIHIAIAADGHGDKNCFRSNIGSQAVCDIALRVILAFAESLEGSDRVEELFLEKHGERMATHLFQSILGEWTEQMYRHAKENPPTEEELKKASDSAAQLYRSGRWLTHMYGTTLIAALMTDRYALLLHQGDGRCTVIHRDGSMSQPVPWDPRCEGRNTTSMCDPDVVSSWRYAIIDRQEDPIIGVYCSSDGVEDSFETMEETLTYLGALTADYVDEGREHYLQTLGPHFSSLSQHGSLDDVTLSAILDVEAVKPFVELYRLLRQQSALRMERKKAEERLVSMERKTNYLADQVAKAQAACQQAEQSYETSSSRMRQLWDSWFREKTESESQKNQLQQAKQRLEVALKEQADYGEIRAQIQKKEDDATLELQKLDEKIAALKLEDIIPAAETGSLESVEEDSVYEPAEAEFSPFTEGPADPSEQPPLRSKEGDASAAVDPSRPEHSTEMPLPADSRNEPSSDGKTAEKADEP